MTRAIVAVVAPLGACAMVSAAPATEDASSPRPAVRPAFAWVDLAELLAVGSTTTRDFHAPSSVASSLAPSGSALRSSPFAPITLGPIGFTSRVLDERDRRWAGSDQPTRAGRPASGPAAADPDGGAIVMASGGGDGNNTLIAPLSGGYDIGTEQVPSFLDEPMDEDNSSTIVVPLPTPALLTALGLIAVVGVRAGLARRMQRT